MIFRYPDFYERFSCVAGRCEDTCCAGWEIDIDDESYRYYMSVPGAFGERLRQNIQEYDKENNDVYEQHGFILREGKRCPFLDKNNLCELYRELGEDALCDVCADTPRNYFEYGGERELALSVSCPEAARLVYEKEEKTTFVEKEIDDEYEPDDSDEEIQIAGQIRNARDRSLALLQNREKEINGRISDFLRFATEFQEQLNGVPIGKTHSPLTPYRMFLKRMVMLTGLESISGEWERWLELLNETFVEPKNGEQIYMNAHRDLKREIHRCHREYEYEHLLVYHAFLFLVRSVDDYDFIGKAKLAILSFLIIRDMDAVKICVSGEFTKKDREDIARIYAKELEHSQDNMELMADEILFEESYNTANLERAVFL